MKPLIWCVAFLSVIAAGVTTAAADYTALYLPIFDTNEGTDTIQIVTIAFGAADPSRVTGDVPGVDYGTGSLVACSLPFGVPEVVWLNGAVVPAERTAWGGSIKSLFR